MTGHISAESSMCCIEAHPDTGVRWDNPARSCPLCSARKIAERAADKERRMRAQHVEELQESYQRGKREGRAIEEKRISSLEQALELLSRRQGQAHDVYHEQLEGVLEDTKKRSAKHAELRKTLDDYRTFAATLGGHKLGFAQGGGRVTVERLDLVTKEFVKALKGAKRKAG